MPASWLIRDSSPLGCKWNSQTSFLVSPLLDIRTPRGGCNFPRIRCTLLRCCGAPDIYLAFSLAKTRLKKEFFNLNNCFDMRRCFQNRHSSKDQTQKKMPPCHFLCVFPCQTTTFQGCSEVCSPYHLSMALYLFPSPCKPELAAFCFLSSPAQ